MHSSDSDMEDIPDLMSPESSDDDSMIGEPMPRRKPLFPSRDLRDFLDLDSLPSLGQAQDDSSCSSSSSSEQEDDQEMDLFLAVDDNGNAYAFG